MKDCMQTISTSILPGCFVVMRLASPQTFYSLTGKPMAKPLRVRKTDYAATVYY